MTREDFTRQLPDFGNNLLGIKPPLVFRGVSARSFSLRANLDLLQQLVDCYINIVPREAGYFRVAAPYVNLVILDYGQMGEAVMTAGWFSQTEIYFGVSLEWYKWVHGQYVFHDWAVITPYIFVTDDVSAPVGRTVYGFQKIFSEVQQAESQWTKDPVAPTKLARIATKVFPQAYTGGNLVNRVFLEIERAPISNFQTPPNLQSPILPWSIASSLAKAASGFVRDLMWLPQALRIFPINPMFDPAVLPAMTSRVMPMFAPGNAGYSLNAINLKQFRLASDPSKICFQALTNVVMETTALNAGGLLGENRVMLGDLSGGHTIYLMEHSSLPIARTLGLELNDSWSDDTGLRTAELKPILPTWMNVDLRFTAGSNLAWRTDRGEWRDETGVPFGAIIEKEPAFNSTVSTSIQAIAGPFQFEGTTIRVIPLLSKRTDLQDFLERYINAPLRAPLPLKKEDDSDSEYVVQFRVWARATEPDKADKSKAETVKTKAQDAEKSVRDILCPLYYPGSQAEPERVDAEFAYVYLTCSSFDSVTSKNDNVGDWAKFELSFMIPVKWQRMLRAYWIDDVLQKKDWSEIKDEDRKKAIEHPCWETVGVGLVPAFTFADNTITAISRVEIQGIATGRANFVRPESVWLGRGAPAHPKQKLLSVKVEVLPALNTGQTACIHPVIEIIRDEPDRGLGSAPDTAKRWAEQLREELESKKRIKANYIDEMKVARALGLEVLGNQTPFSLYTLKQFRDVSDPYKACYMALIRVSRVLSGVDLQEIDETLTVQISDYPDFNIVEQLGIQATRLGGPGPGILYSTQGLRPFFIRCTLDEPLADHVLSRPGPDPWTIHKNAFKTMLSDEAPEFMVYRYAEKPVFTVDRYAGALQDQLDPSRTPEILYQARDRRKLGYKKGWPIRADVAREAVEIVDAQSVIEAALSREWSNHDPKTRWRAGVIDLAKKLCTLPEPGPSEPEAEAELYRQVNNEMANVPGAVARPIREDELRERLNTETPEATWDSWEKARNDDHDLTTETPPEPLEDWPKAMLRIIKGQFDVAKLRLRLEKNIDKLSPAAILGLNRVWAAAQTPKPPRPAQTTAPRALDATDEWVRKLLQAGRDLVDCARDISRTHIQDEFKYYRNLGTLREANVLRLRELVKILRDQVYVQSVESPQVLLESLTHIEEFGEMVQCARRHCDAQKEVLLNKLSRAYQKPDYCLRRDAFGDQATKELPLPLSWNADWYYGKDPGSNNEESKTTTAQGENSPHPSKTPPEGGA
jgi:hypothetical protein